MSPAPVVICLGEALVDRLGPYGVETPFAFKDTFDDCLGGAPANVACCLARLGTPSAFYGRIGSDSNGAKFLSLFQERGLDTNLLQLDLLHPTRIVLVTRSSNGDRNFLDFYGDLGCGFADQFLAPSPLPNAKWLLVGTVALSSPVSRSALLSTVCIARDQGILIAVDVNWRPTFWDNSADPNSGPSQASIEAVQPLFQQASLIKLSREEALWFFNTSDPTVIKLSLPNHPDVVVTDGSERIRWHFNDSLGDFLPLRPSTIVDTTGAGDAFMAGLLHCWSEPPLDRVRFSSACGSLVCTGIGGIDPQPTEFQVHSFLGGKS